MPIYEFICEECERPFEELVRNGQNVSCPSCSSTDVRRLLSSFREVLSLSGYPGRGRSREVLGEIESFVKRGKPTAREVTLLLGALAALRRGLEVSPSKTRA